MNNERVTLVAHAANNSSLDWNWGAPSPLAFIESIEALESVLSISYSDHRIDIGRAIIDRAGDATQFLDLLTTLPAGFSGDVLLIREDGGAVMSSAARGGNRVLYSLSPLDVRFYLETYDLVTGRCHLHPQELVA